MTCNHSFQDINDLDSDCVACWKERAEKAEACCAEMRPYVERSLQRLKRLYNDPSPVSSATLVSIRIELDKAEHALSTDCGKGWMSPDKSKVLVEALENSHGPKPWHVWGGPVDEKECNVCKALAAVKGERK